MSIIIKPLITEKMTKINEKDNSRCAFIVDKKANKIEIKKAVEDLYSVKVASVNTINYSGKRKARYTKAGYIQGRTNAYKKAMITLAKGETIDFFSNI
ncbi:MAG: 50S ribosomal protein L23 [Synergistales bacterium]|jgi:large subunit ribosomal protein L23|nr:50S ribosomal protein L23 [Bacteroidales bacterium]MDY6434857.1 50S ribosomal protein L23 [Synergistales bacterium]MBQ6753656.1 50S ribosomal protein L23 [Bacteroidales bacterium]MDY6381406.1 50S ribosomal protein L23 [Bacteroidales bacterium]MDY6394242.1 50S ribosomal protein L23 [Bacteroidales bacterium]